MGVRQLERDVAKICRKIAYKGNKEVINVKRVNDILGRRREERLWTGVGVVKGMAWTVNGGKVLIVEAVKSVGKGKIEITGQLGDVMKESVKIALSWIKANFGMISMLNQNVINLH
jgi:ATP-dependent Lon protease